MVPKALFLQTPTPATEPATGITHLQSVQGLAAPVRAQLLVSSAKQLANCMPVVAQGQGVPTLQPTPLAVKGEGEHKVYLAKLTLVAVVVVGR